MQKIIPRHPQAFEEINQFGHSPLHLAISYPTCLRLMLEAGGSSILENSDFEGLTPLECACLSGCMESARLLIAAGSRITNICLWRVDETCQNGLAIASKQRRDELKQLAINNLTRTEAESLKLHENTVLDANALMVQQLLQKRGVNIPSRLHVELWIASVYHVPRPQCQDKWIRIQVSRISCVFRIIRKENQGPRVRGNLVIYIVRK